jgi:amino acid adenylation domain-containing protein
MKTENHSKKTADKLIQWIRQYAALHIDSHLADEQCSFPPHVLLDLGNQGFFGIHISRKYGGLELTTSDMLRVIEQVAAIDLTLSVILIESIQGAHTLEKYASESMKDKYLNQMATGRIFTAGAMTESEAGSNPRAMKSVAVPDKENGWRIKGSKRWVGMGASARIIALYVQQLDLNNNWLGMSGFLVEQGTDGLCIGHDTPTMGIRGFSKNTITMDNINVLPEHLLGKTGEGMEIAQDNMMYIRLCLAAAAVGAMKRCAQLMYRYAEQRLIATGSLLENPVTLVRLSEITAVIDAIDSFVYLISGIYDEDPSLVPEEAFVIAKIIGSEYLGWVADLAVQMLGARGYEASCDVSKIFRDARVFRIFEGPTEALNMYIGSRALEKNSTLETFISKTLKQKPLFDSIKQNVQRVSESCLSNKNELFSKPFSVNYWAQALVGDVITYGLFLACVQYNLLENDTPTLQRASLWARNKYDDALEKALAFSLGEKVIYQSGKLKEAISTYANTIGNVDQIRKGKNIAIDQLLTLNTEGDIKANISPIGHELFSKKSSNPDDSPKEPLCASEAERQQLLYKWNTIEQETCYVSTYAHQLFEEQVSKTPSAVAVVYNDQQITYETLNAEANKVAHYLISKGIKKDKLVALYFERSIEMIVGLLGVLKAGGGYLPLDYNYPEKHLKFMLEDSESALILSHRKLSLDFPFDSTTVAYIEDILENSMPGSEKNSTLPISGDSVGYVIYTSGSTGQPKGVILPQRALANLINWHNKKINGKRNVLQFTTLNFDMSFIEIFSALGSGGALTLISEQDRLDISCFSKIIKKQAVDQLVLSVPFLKNLANSQIEKTCFETIKEIIIAGEQLVITPAILTFFKQLNACKLLNYYGPSETHVVTAYEFPRNTADWPDYPPIGKAIPNTKVLLLADDKQPVPVGAIGEIYIGGFCLANGYVHRGELTQEKFIANPWGDDLLYRSGDLGKYLPDGNLVYLGRKDEQVKIRGYRIEPQEIEWHLLKFPHIKEAVVIAKKGLLDKHLEAFIVVEGAVNGNFTNDIYSFLQDRIPIHMLPSVFNIIDKMPLTNSGKIDRIALEKQQSSMTYSVNNVMVPETDTEKEIINIMEDIFKVRIGVNNSFFAIGGNSLMAMHIIAKLRDKFSVELPAYSILSDPTIADTAKRIDALRDSR